MRFLATLEKPKPIRRASVLRKKAVLKRFFQHQPVDIVFLHGALARDAMKPLSDVDIAVLFRGEKYTFDNISKVILRLEDLFKREDIDLGVLNRASPLFWMQVLKNGIVLYARSQQILKQFRLQTIRRYLRTRHLRTTFNQRVAAAILRGRK